MTERSFPAAAEAPRREEGPHLRRTRVVLGVLGMAVALLAGLYLLMNARTLQVAGELTARVETDRPVVALTFDDGPTPRAEEVLDLLDELDVRVTFFVTGRELAAHPELGRRMVEAGHELGNHSWSHQRMVGMSRARIREELERTDEEIRAVGHTGSIHFRPPYGKKLIGLPRHLAEEGRHTVMWDVEPESDAATAADASAIAAHVLAAVEPGSIVLLHPMYEANEPTRKALPTIIDGLLRQGYTPVTISELLSPND